MRCRPARWADGPAFCLRVKKTHRMVVVNTELVGDDHGFAQHTLARLDIVRVGIGQRLEDGERDEDLADAPGVLPLPACHSA